MAAPALAWDRFREAPDSQAKRAADQAASAAQGPLDERASADADTIRRLKTNLETLRRDLRETILAGPGSVTDFRRFQATALISDIDRILAEYTERVASGALPDLEAALEQGAEGAERPLRAVNLMMAPGLIGVDAALVRQGFDNVIDLLTVPMQQFRREAVTSIRRIALAGDNRADEIARLRDLMDESEPGGVDNAAFKAERIIRTEVSRVFNAATFQRLQSLAQEFPFLRKGWRDSKDSRVRTGHKTAGQIYKRGAGIKVGELFKVPVFDSKGTKRVGTVLMRFPVDPQAKPAGKLAAQATIMCRCNAFVDFDLDEFAAFTRKTLISDISPET